MDLSDYVRIARRNSWLLLAGLVVGLLAALGVTIYQPPRYESTAKVYVSTVEGASVDDLNQGATYAQQVVKSYATIATTPFVLDVVIQRLGLDVRASTLARDIVVSVPDDQTVLQIAATSSSPQAAADIADAIAGRLESAVVDLAPTSSGGATVRVTQIQGAEVAQRASSPNGALNLLIGLVVGLALAALLALLRVALDTRVRNAGEVERVTRAPMLGSVGYDPTIREVPLVVHESGRSSSSEAYRAMRTNLKYLARGKQERAMVVTSSVESEGKSTTTANLALALADSGERVLVVDADLRRPRIATYFGIEGGIGLTDVLVDAVPLEKAVQHWGDKGLALLPAGTLPPNPSELLDSEEMRALIKRVRSKYDTVLFDAPPLLPVTDAAALAKEVGGAIVVVSVRRVHRQQLQHALANLQRLDARIVGTVVTMVPRRGPDAPGYGYGYGYGYEGEKSAVVQPRRRWRRRLRAATAINP